MTKQKTVPELKAEIAANERQLAQLRHKQQQLENRAAYYEKGDRRKRAHRLITRGAAVESPVGEGVERNRILRLCGKSPRLARGQGFAHGGRQRAQQK